LTDAQGVPLGVAVSGANVHDKRLVRETIESIPVERPQPTKKNPQNMCQDKGYDYPDARELVAEFGYTAHIPARGTDPAKKQKLGGPLFPREAKAVRGNSGYGLAALFRAGSTVECSADMATAPQNRSCGVHG
jgi:transposase